MAMVQLYLSRDRFRPYLRKIHVKYPIPFQAACSCIGHKRECPLGIGYMFWEIVEGEVIVVQFLSTLLVLPCKSYCNQKEK